MRGLRESQAMTHSEVQSKLRELTRETKRLRRLLRGPRAKAAKKARDAERRKRVEAILEAWRDIKWAVGARAGGQCEVINGPHRCADRGAECDHFFGGIGRRRQRQSVEGTWLLCGSHHRNKTLNLPSRAWWLNCFHEHVLAHGLKSQLPLIAAERARIEGKGRP